MPADAKGKFTIEQRREQVAQLYLAGANQTEIAKQLGMRMVNSDNAKTIGAGRCNSDPFAHQGLRT